MKRLRFLAIISVLLFGVLGGFVVPEKSLAETQAECLTAAGTSEIRRNNCIEKAKIEECLNNSGTSEAKRNKCTRNQTGNYGSFQEIITNYHSAALQTIRAAAESHQGKTTYEFQQKVSKDYETASEKNYQAYLNALNTEEGKSTDPAKAQIAGIQAWIKSMNDGATLALTRAYSSSPQKSAYDQYAKNVQDALTVAIKIDRGEITAGSAEASVLTTDAATIVNAANGNKNTAKEVIGKGGACSISFTGTFSITGCIDEFIAWIITHTFLQIVGYLLWLTANLMNFSIKMGILDFAKWAPDTLYPIWIVVRQIISLVIVFAGLYLGFMYIIDRGKEFERYIPWVVMFALFVNFSYPFVRTIVDVSNIVSLNIYTSTVGKEVLTGGSSGEQSAGAIIRNKLGLIGLVDYATGNEKANEGAVLNNIKSTPVALLAVIFIGYAAYIFFMVTALIVMRTVALIFLIVASPILLVDSVIPALGDKAKEMRKLFFEQLVVGPVFMIMFALTLKFLDVFKTGSNSAMGSANAISSSGGGDTAVAMFFNLLIMLVMLHIMLKVTKSTAGSLGEMATGAIGKVGGFGLGVASGGAGFLARGTIGRGAAALRDSKWVTSNQTNILGRTAHGMSNSIASSTFDLRNSKVVAGQANKLGVGMGMGSKMGYEQAQDARAKDRADRLAYVGTYSKDVFDADGKLTHKKGDLDQSIAARKSREDYIKSAGGLSTGARSIFTSKQSQDEARQRLLDESKKGNKDQDASILSEYNGFEDTVNPDGSISSAKEKKVKFLEDLREKLEKERVKDENLTGSEAQSLLKKINVIEKANKLGRENFKKEATAAFKEYKAKLEKGEGEVYLASKSEELTEAILKLSRGESLDEPKEVISEEKESASLPENEPLQVTYDPNVAISNERSKKLAIAMEQARTEMGEKPPKREDGEAGGATETAPVDPKNPPKPGFLMTAEEKIRARASRIEREKNQQETPKKEEAQTVDDLKWS